MHITCEVLSLVHPVTNVKINNYLTKDVPTYLNKLYSLYW